MPFDSLRDFIAKLESTGRLVRVTVPVSPVLEMTEIQTRLLAEQVETYSRQAEEMGRMVTGHALLVCPACGLAEDTLADLTVRVVHPDHPDVDTGLRFEAADESETVWTCPACGELFEGPGNSGQAD